MMVSRLWFIGLMAATLLFSSCGPSEEEQQQRAQARQDSLEQVRQERLQQQRRDSIAQANRRQQQEEGANKQRSVTNLFSSNGRYVVHVESWRSEDKAAQRVQQWKKRGFTNANTIRYGDESTGNIWFRVRLGAVDSRQDAQRVKQALADKYQTDSWLSVQPQ